jgi:maltooligosyltrehalose trehalohydrolase
MNHNADLGLEATYLGDNRCAFRVWAPRATRVDLHITAPEDCTIPMTADTHGYFATLAEGVAPGTRYLFRLDDEKERPDPASRAQPDGVHTASQVLDPTFAWSDAHWRGLPLQHYIIYEMHVGTFTSEGTFDAAIAHLDMLTDLGITAVELLPVAHFPGSRNWGYDGVYLYATHTAYGGAAGLKRFVDACHQRGLAVIMDVVYNHLGPEGNYLWDYGYYFTERYQTPWGAAVNFDGPHSDEVRRFFLENALMWVDDFHIDALRIDAVHAMRDFSAKTFMQELAEVVEQRAQRLGRQICTIAESDQNDRRLVNPPALGGYGFDAQWSDDFHHTLHTLLTGERDGYYADFGTFDQLMRVYHEGWVYAGDYSAFRQRRHGSSARDIPPYRLVVCTQNHDQVGNRMLGERLSTLISYEAYKLAAGLLLFSPFIPMLFMGEEYGEPAPFLYFVSHNDPDLVEAVRKGRKAEFSAFAWKGEAPDPQAETTFADSRLDHTLREQKGVHEILYRFYRECIRLRKSLPALALLDKTTMHVQGFEQEQVLLVRRWIDPTEAGLWQPSVPPDKVEGREVMLLFNLNTSQVTMDVPFPQGTWRCLLDSTDNTWQLDQVRLQLDEQATFTSSETGTTLTINPHACMVFTRQEVL